MLPLTIREEAELQRKERKTGEISMTWSFWSSVDIPPTGIVLPSIIIMMKMSLKTAATAKIIPDETGKTDMP